jgi:hypothetical protein
MINYLYKSSIKLEEKLEEKLELNQNMEGIQNF